MTHKESLEKKFEGILPKDLTHLINEYSIYDFVENITYDYFNYFFDPDFIRMLNMQEVVASAIPNFEKAFEKTWDYFKEHEKDVVPSINMYFSDISDETESGEKLRLKKIKQMYLMTSFLSHLAVIFDGPFFTLYPFFQHISFDYDMSITNEDKIYYRRLAEYAMSGKMSFLRKLRDETKSNKKRKGME